ncbi:hypothetical protein BDA99DRAFT_533679 [Phascolomyces articulosus]|uniref:Uncharacterized protein n=1 Tax=Phascolomyces articulosus TaxID=60185 RepID=A0AAD5K7G4_9FUNG|nr:hypothetical protein BDA99DRAFT_533679 [Phascolomyces articulosus]
MSCDNKWLKYNYLFGIKLQYMVEWLETEDNFKLVTGQIAGFIPGTLKKYTKAHGYKSLQEHKKKKGIIWNLEQVKGRLRDHKDKYIKARNLTKDVRGSSGAGVNIEDSRTFADMLEEICPFYERMHALYGERQDIELEAVLEAGSGRLVVRSACDPALLMPQPQSTQEEQHIEEGEEQQQQQQQQQQEAQEEQVLASDFDAVYTTSNSADEEYDDEEGEEDEYEDVEANDEEEDDEDKAVEIARRGFESSFRGFTKDLLHLDEKVYLENKNENKRKAFRWEHEVRMHNKKMKNDLMIAAISYLPKGLSPQETKKFRDELFDSE